jgi:hypothetical protein
MDPGDPDCGECLRRRRGLWKPSVSELPSSAPDMSEAEEDDPVWDGDGNSWLRQPAAGVVVRAASSAAVGQATTRAAVETSAFKTAAREAAALAADRVATTAAIEGASKTAHEGVAVRAAVGWALASVAVEGAAVERTGPL